MALILPCSVNNKFSNMEFILEKIKKNNIKNILYYTFYSNLKHFHNASGKFFKQNWEKIGCIRTNYTKCYIFIN